ncbi:pentapeptide repeat-containing protein [Streptomyces cellostaticus]|nr:pentapeptide repeat-containing protein [Streptomyces cellostaticus]
MTMLTCIVDSVGLVLTAGLPPQPPGQGTPSTSPWWAPLVGGLGGALIGGAIAALAAWFSARQLRQSAQEELGHERVRLLNERFATAAGLLGHEEPACQLAGIHAMAGLADDWIERRQTCIDVLSAFLRMPYTTEATTSPPTAEHLTWQANREVRHTVIRAIRDHLQDGLSGSGTSWEGYDFDFTGAVFDGGSFSGARFSGGTVSFSGATFSGGTVDLSATFSGSEVDFTGARFTGGEVDFRDATFSGGKVDFRNAEFSDGEVDFGATFSGGTVNFSATFSGSEVDFTGARFAGSTVYFSGATFSGGKVDFSATFSGGAVEFSEARFTGSRVDFCLAQFSGGTVDLRRPRAWWPRPPEFDDVVGESPPVGLRLPHRGGA